MPISLNGKPPLGYRIGTTDRTIGAPALNTITPPIGTPVSYPEGFLVLNTTNGNVFEVVGGVWAAGTMDATLLAAWKAETVINSGVGYRIGTTDRELGAATDAPAGFLVLNTTNNAVFESSGGVWVDGGVFPAALLEAWQNS
jgi:hypothetical protein